MDCGGFLVDSGGFLRAFTSQAAQVRTSFEKRHLENTKVGFGGFLMVLVGFKSIYSQGAPSGGKIF